MSLNSNTAYLQYWEHFSLLGKSMNRYVIASIISLAASFIGGLIMQFYLIAPMMASMDSSSYDDPYALLLGMGGISLVFIIIVFPEGKNTVLTDNP